MVVDFSNGISNHYGRVFYLFLAGGDDIIKDVSSMFEGIKLNVPTQSIIFR